MNTLMKTDETYLQWIQELKSRYQTAQIKASVSVNREMLLFYWSLGRDIVSFESNKKWGSAFYETLCSDLKQALPGVQGLSTKNLYYMRRFYLLTADAVHFPQAVGKSQKQNFPQDVGKNSSPFFCIPWGHIRIIIDKYGKDPERA